MQHWRYSLISRRQQHWLLAILVFWQSLLCPSFHLDQNGNYGCCHTNYESFCDARPFACLTCSSFIVQGGDPPNTTVTAVDSQLDAPQPAPRNDAEDDDDIPDLAVGYIDDKDDDEDEEEATDQAVPSRRSARIAAGTNPPERYT